MVMLFQNVIKQTDIVAQYGLTSVLDKWIKLNQTTGSLLFKAIIAPRRTKIELITHN